AEIGRVIYGSTIWVYSDCPESDVDEDTRLAHPGHLYTATKLAGEMYCRSYAELYGVDYTILRFGIPYGPRARDATVVAVFVKKALAGEPLTVAGSGAQSRQFVYVRDLADGGARGRDAPARARRREARARTRAPARARAPARGRGTPAPTGSAVARCAGTRAPAARAAPAAERGPRVRGAHVELRHRRLLHHHRQGARRRS